MICHPNYTIPKNCHPYEETLRRNTYSRVHNPIVEMSLVERRELISALAYCYARKNGFGPGHDNDNWLKAEAEVYSALGTKDC